MLLVNDLKPLDNYYAGDKSFKKNGVWVPEIDICVANNNVVRYKNKIKTLMYFSRVAHRLTMPLSR